VRETAFEDPRRLRATYESTVTANSGATRCGDCWAKLNMDEFAMGSSNMTSAYGPVENPCAVRVRSEAGAWWFVGWLCIGCRARMALVQPALTRAVRSVSGCVLRHRRHQADLRSCSRWGTIAFARRSIRRTVRTPVKDTAILLRSMSGFDPKDSTSVDMQVPRLG